jgi:hypothetical protein
LNFQFPFHTAIWILFNMILVGVLATFSLNQSFSRMAISPDAKRKWQAIVIISLLAWFIERMILGHSRVVNMNYEGQTMTGLT